VRAAPSSHGRLRAQPVDHALAGRQRDRRLGQQPRRRGELGGAGGGHEHAGQHAEQRRLAGAVGACHRDAVTAMQDQVDVAQPARAHAAQCGDAPAPAAVGLQPQSERGTLDRRGDRLLAPELAPQPTLTRPGLPGDLLGVALELVGARSARRALGVLRLAPRGGDVGLEPSSSLLLGLVLQRQLRPPPLPLRSISAVAALVAGQRSTGLELEDAADDRIEEGAIVRDHHDGAREAPQPALEPRQAVAVEVIGRLVEQEHGRAGHQGAGHQRAGLLAARQPRQRLVGRRRPRGDSLDGQRAVWVPRARR